MTGYTKQTLLNAKRLRRELTEAERLLWSALRGGQIEGAKVRRQQPIGPYIGDFVCQAHRLIIEADGSQHHECEHDQARDAYLKSVGYRVLRFWNSDILTNLEGVLEAIRQALLPPHPPIAAQWGPSLSLKGRGQ